MSDTRFTILGIVLIFAGFLVLGVFGSNFQTNLVEMTEFGDCYDYSQEKQIPVNCSYKVFEQGIFFALVIAILVFGIISLIKGVRGNWDSKVKPEDMTGPGNNQNSEKEDKN